VQGGIVRVKTQPWHNPDERVELSTLMKEMKPLPAILHSRTLLDLATTMATIGWTVAKP